MAGGCKAVAEVCLRTRRQSRRESSCRRPEFTPLGVALLTWGRVCATPFRVDAPRAGPPRAHRLCLRQRQRHRSAAGALPDVATCVESLCDLTAPFEAVVSSTSTHVGEDIAAARAGHCPKPQDMNHQTCGAQPQGIDTARRSSSESHAAQVGRRRGRPEDVCAESTAPELQADLPGGSGSDLGCGTSNESATSSSAA